MSARRAVSVLLALLFVAALLLAAGCGKKETSEPATGSEEGGLTGTVKRELKAPGEAREAAGAANKQIEKSQPKSPDDL